jgi:hypothetical protein
VKMRGRRFTRLVLVTALVGLVALPGAAGGFAPFPQHRCGSFVRPAGESEGYEYPAYRITVYNSDGLACKLATEVIQAFWDPDDEPHHHGGRSEAESWYTTDRFPSWRCTQGAGGGSCRHKHKVAGYSVKVA